MKVYQCEDMVCNHCVLRIEAALSEAKIQHQVNLNKKTVEIMGDDGNCQKAEEILDDLGFTPIPVQ